MQIALIDTTPKPKVYPVSLLKIGAWRKSLGDRCALFSNTVPKENGFDEAWITTCFTYDMAHALNLARRASQRIKKVKVGGIAATLLPDYFESRGFEVHRGLLPEAEKMPPDYSLLEKRPTYSITHASRGCSRRCKFCMVSKLEPDFVSREHWEQDLDLNAKQILFFDNNWLAKNYKDLKVDADKIKDLVKEKRIKTVDFNQGLDCRLLTEKKADLFRGLPIDPVRFAFDNMSEDKHFQRAVRMLMERGLRRFSYYALYNYMDTPDDFYYRIKQGALLKEELGISVEVFPMRYQPILEINRNRDYTGKHWTPRKRFGFMAILAIHSACGQISMHGGRVFTPTEEFEFWFGKNAKEFNRLILYPQIRLLSERKQEKLRHMRLRLKLAEGHGKA